MRLRYPTALRQYSSSQHTLRPFTPEDSTWPSVPRGDFCRRLIPQTMLGPTITILGFRTFRVWVGTTLATKRRAKARKGQLRQVYLENSMIFRRRT